MDSETCGECHKKIYHEWNASSHHYASFNNQFYRKAIEAMQDTRGTPQGSRWCAGCHDHAVFFNGRFDQPIKGQIDTPEAHAGLACTTATPSFMWTAPWATTDSLSNIRRCTS